MVAVAISDKAVKKITTLAPPRSPGGHLGTRDRVNGGQVLHPSLMHIQTKDGGTFCILRCLDPTHPLRRERPQ